MPGATRLAPSPMDFPWNAACKMAALEKMPTQGKAERALWKVALIVATAVLRVVSVLRACSAPLLRALLLATLSLLEPRYAQDQEATDQK